MAADFNHDGFIDVFHSDLRTQIFALFLNQKGRGFFPIREYGVRA